MIVKILIRRDTTENWTLVNPILGQGEFGIEIFQDGNRKIKIGDGITSWMNLPYAYISAEEFAEHITDPNAHGISGLFGALNDENNQIKDNISGVIGDVEAVRNKVNNLENSNAGIAAAVNNISSAVGQNKIDSDNNFNNLNASVLTINGKITTLETANGNVNVNLTNLENRINQNKIDADYEVNGIKNRVTALESSDVINKNDIQTLRNDVLDIQQNTNYSGLTQTIGRVDALETDVGILKNKTGILETSAAQNASDVAVINGSVSNLNARVNNLETSDSNMVEDVNNFKNYIDGRVSNAEYDVVNLQNDVTNIKWDIADIKNTGLYNSNDIVDLKNRFDDYANGNDAIISEIHADITNIKWDVANLQNANNDHPGGDLTDFDYLNSKINNHVNNDTDAHGIDDIKDKIDDVESDLNVKIDDANADLIAANTNLNNHVNNDTDAHGIDDIKSDVAEINLEITGLKETVENIDIVSIKGSVDSFAELPDPTDLLDGTAYIVEEDENLDGVTTIYAAINGAWEFIGRFNIDLSNYYTKQEVDDLLNEKADRADTFTKSEANDNFASKSTAIRNDVTNQQNIIGTLSMGNNKVTDVAAPTNNNDAANKSYVDLRTVDYSTNEQATGLKWIDGKPIYRKTFTGTITAAANAITSTPVPLVSENLVNCGGWVAAYNNTNSARIQLGYYYSGAFFASIYLDTNNLNIISQSNSPRSNAQYQVWVEYTKP